MAGGPDDEIPYNDEPVEIPGNKDTDNRKEESL
jgi:hypothetical protein